MKYYDYRETDFGYLTFFLPYILLKKSLDPFYFCLIMMLSNDAKVKILGFKVKI